MVVALLQKNVILYHRPPSDRGELKARISWYLPKASISIRASTGIYKTQSLDDKKVVTGQGKQRLVSGLGNASSPGCVVSSPR